MYTSPPAVLKALPADDHHDHEHQQDEAIGRSGPCTTTQPLHKQLPGDLIARLLCHVRSVLESQAWGVCVCVCVGGWAAPAAQPWLLTSNAQRFQRDSSKSRRQHKAPPSARWQQTSPAAQGREAQSWRPSSALVVVESTPQLTSYPAAAGKAGSPEFTLAHEAALVHNDL
jgi:hypothetical protein